jgi:acyl carrier protein
MNVVRDHDDVMAFLRDAIQELVDADEDQLTRDAVLEELDLISLDYVELHVLVKKRYGAALSMDLFVNGDIVTLGQLADHIVNYTAPPVVAAVAAPAEAPR